MSSASRPRILVDAGPIIAFLAANEPHHAWANDLFQTLPAPFVTCEAVLTEAFFLASRDAEGRARLWELLTSDHLITDFSIVKERQALAALMDKYRDLPMSLADACLVRMAELAPEARVFTLDAHFRVYRKNGRQTVPLIAP